MSWQTDSVSWRLTGLDRTAVIWSVLRMIPTKHVDSAAPPAASADIEVVGIALATIAAVSVGGLLALSPSSGKLAIGGLAVGAFGVIALIDPWGAFQLFLPLALTVWISQFRVVGQVSLTPVLGLLVFGGWALKVLWGKLALAPMSEYWLVIVFGCVAVLKVIASAGRSGGLSWLSTYVQLVFLAVLVVQLASTRDRLETVGNAIAVSSVLLGLGVVLGRLGWFPDVVSEQVLQLSNTAPSGTVVRASGVWGDPNFTALQLNVGLPFLVRSVATESRRGLRLFAGACMLLLVGAVLLTYSLGGLLGLVGMLAAWILVSRAPGESRRWPWIILVLALGLMAVVFGLLPPMYEYRIEQATSQLQALVTSSSLQSPGVTEFGTGRGAAWLASLRLARAHPLGVGPGVDDVLRAQYQWRRAKRSLAAHNVFLAVLGEFGVQGLLAFAALLYTAWRGLTGDQDSHLQSPAASGMLTARDATLIALTGVLTQGLMLDIQRLKVLWVLIAMGTAYRRTNSQDDTPR